jgi:hypothetical protein
MKRVLILGVLMTLSLSSGALASSKICFGSTKNDDTKSVVLSAKIDAQKIFLKTVKAGGTFGDGYYNGATYPALHTSVHARDGKTYLQYNGEDSDYQDTIMVDETLLKEGTTGLLQIRARGEGFFNFVFVCKDDRPQIP